MRTPCQDDPERWFSVDVNERAHAMGDCLDCPALKWCARLVEQDKPGWGVWAGKDYSPNPATRTFGNCERCGTRFQHPRVGRRRKFCSQECYHASRAVGMPAKSCEWCESEFTKHPSLTAARWVGQRFCSLPCAGAARTAASERRSA